MLVRVEDDFELRNAVETYPIDEIPLYYPDEKKQTEIRKYYIRTYLSTDPQVVERYSEKEAFSKLRKDFLIPFEKQYFDIVIPSKKLEGHNPINSGPHKGRPFAKVCYELGFEKLYVQYVRSFSHYFILRPDITSAERDFELRRYSFTFFGWDVLLNVVEHASNPIYFLSEMISVSNPYLYFISLCAVLYKGRVDLFDQLIGHYSGQFSEFLQSHYHSDDGLTVSQSNNPKKKGTKLSLVNVLAWNIQFKHELDLMTLADYARESESTEQLETCLKRHRLNWACYTGDYEGHAELFDNAGALLREGDMSPILACANSQEPENHRILNRLFKQPLVKAMMHRRDTSNATPLQIAMRNNKPELFSRILSASTDEIFIDYSKNELVFLLEFAYGLRNILIPCDFHIPFTRLQAAITNVEAGNDRVIQKYTDHLYSQATRDFFLERNGLMLARDYLYEVSVELIGSLFLNNLTDEEKTTHSHEQYKFAQAIVLHHYNTYSQSRFWNVLKRPEVTAVNVDYSRYKAMKDTKRKAKSQKNATNTFREYRVDDSTQFRFSLRDSQSTNASENFGVRFRKVVSLSEDSKTLTCFFANPKQEQFFVDKLKAFEAIGTRATGPSPLVEANVFALRCQSLSDEIDNLCSAFLNTELMLQEKLEGIKRLISLAPGIISEHLKPNPRLIVELVIKLLSDESLSIELIDELISALSLQQLFSETPFERVKLSFFDLKFSYNYATDMAEAYCHLVENKAEKELSLEEQQRCTQLSAAPEDGSPLPKFLRTETYLIHAAAYQEAQGQQISSLP